MYYSENINTLSTTCIHIIFTDFINYSGGESDNKPTSAPSL